ncbi:MAG: hypothetical protein F4Y60_09620 [Boseongicola sp. SB0664_bin_43]|uniref:Uncharacterized protein n=1 Tax=Boseongicola sp. SB0664_bin_43 TaxID=2604844 RepID=A0A6B0Y0T9_9RHOB|nr:hypothetical protein [Boseongicola sp. SB0664_bin_43]
MTDVPGVFDGIRVPDVAQMMLGRPCTQTSADTSAVVLKIERHGKGGWRRSMPMIGGFVGKEGAAFHTFNRNERSITIDLKPRDGRVPLLAMANACDVVTGNFRTGVTDRLGLGHEDFKSVNSKFTYARRSGRSTGSWQARQGMGRALLNRPIQAAGRGPGRDRYRARNCGGCGYRGLSRCRADRA